MSASITVSRIRLVFVALAFLAVFGSTVGVENSLAGPGRDHFANYGTASSYIETGVKNGVPYIRNSRTYGKLNITIAYVVDLNRTSLPLTQSAIGVDRWKAFPYFKVGNSADGICYDIADDGKKAFCNWNVNYK